MVEFGGGDFPGLYTDFFQDFDAFGAKGTAKKADFLFFGSFGDGLKEIGVFFQFEEVAEKCPRGRFVDQ